MSLTATAFSAEQLAAMNPQARADDPHDVRLAADRARWNALEAAGFRPLEATGALEGPTTRVSDAAFFVETRAPRAWRAPGWLLGIPAWLGCVTYEGVSVTARVRTVSTNPDSDDVVDKTAEHADATLEPALLRALDERLQGWAARELLDEIASRELEAPAIVVMQWRADRRTTVTLTTDDPLRADVEPVELHLPTVDAGSGADDEQLCLADAA